MNLLEMEYRESAADWRYPAPESFRPRSYRRPTLVEAAIPASDWREAVEARLRRLQKYELGWDGYQGKPPRSAVIEFARSILSSVMKPSVEAPSIVPLSGGGLQLEWHNGGLDIEVTIYAPFQAELTVEYHDGREAAEELPLVADFSELGAVLEELA